jgi:hypothetical protein
VRQTAHLGEELLGDDADVGLLEAGGGEDVHDAARDDRLRDDLPNGVLDVDLGAAAGRQRRPHDGRLHGLEEGHLARDLGGLGGRGRERERLRQLRLGRHEPVAAVVEAEDV